jgi:CDP-glycerol glycerophosphotransferase
MKETTTMGQGRYAALASRLAKSTLAGGLERVAPLDERPWVFGGASGRSYSDNASVLHQALRVRAPAIPSYWVIDADSPDRALAATIGPVAERGALLTHRLTLDADVIVFSHGIHDVPGMYRNTKAIRVRLPHGFTALKRKSTNPRSGMWRLTRAVDLSPVASKMEQDFRADWGFDRAKLPITGMPRWDVMVEERSRRTGVASRPLVFYAPTWRPWHRPDQESLRTDLAPLMDFLGSDRLHRLMAARGFDLALYVHQITRYHLGERIFDVPGVTVVTDERSLPATIANSSLVVTDYSSIAWDALYLDIPTIFFHHDLALYERRVGSYVDLRQRLFGPQVFEPTALIDAIEAGCADGFTYPAWRADRERWQERAFAHRDDGNVTRVLEAICDRLDARGQAAS